MRDKAVNATRRGTLGHQPKPYARRSGAAIFRASAILAFGHFWDDAVAAAVRQIELRKVIRIRGDEFPMQR